jgi:hypothetical protein
LPKEIGATRHDLLILYWYAHRFGGRWPFVKVSANEALRAQLGRPFCRLKACQRTAA